MLPIHNFRYLTKLGGILQDYVDCNNNLAKIENFAAYSQFYVQINGFAFILLILVSCYVCGKTFIFVALKIKIKNKKITNFLSFIPNFLTTPKKLDVL